jgi:4-aminobutyrate aminotransferase / (S)-3-amino-2-methylpropionate transaminase / 5-aminovalerate transaminase
MKATLEGTRAATGICPPTSPEIHQLYLEEIKNLGKLKGRDSYFQYLSSGMGSGPFVELMDGSRKLDLINGIGINFFGHSHPALIEELIEGVTSDVMQGNLQPGFEAQDILRTVLANVGAKSNLKHGWLFGSGTMANETALKIIRQKKFPATRIFAFSDCFAGRSTAMQEITDNPKYREGQPTYGEVTHLPFYDPSLGIEKSISQTVGRLEEEVRHYPGKYAGMMIELVQGEGGIRYAPREWYIGVFEAAKKAGLAIWADEIQTFGRLEQLFAYQHFDLAEYLDVVTIGKLLQACMTLYTEDMNPKAGLVAGTFTGSAATLRTGRRVVEMLTQNGYYGENGKIAKLSLRFRKGIEALKSGSCRGKIGDVRIIGGMIGFGVFNQTLDDTKAFLMQLFEVGAVAFYAGHDPYLVRCLPSFGVMDESEVDLALTLIEKTLLSFKS